LEGKRHFKIVNQRQAYKFISNGLKPIDIYAGYEEKLVFVFEDCPLMKELFEKWRNYEL
jgi:hypothetical protein